MHAVAEVPRIYLAGKIAQNDWRHDLTSAPIGDYFLTFDASNVLDRQGQIVGSPEPGHYVCQLYSWITGTPTNRVVVPTAELVGWRFYPTVQQWRTAAEVLRGGQW